MIEPTFQMKMPEFQKNSPDWRKTCASSRSGGEALDLADEAVVRDLDISVARVGTGGLDAHGHQGVVAGGEVEALADDGAEVLLVEDQVVRRGDDHFGPGVALHERVGRIGDAGGRVAADRLAEHLLRGDLGDVLQHQVLVFDVGHHEKVLGRDHLGKSFVGVADEGFSRSEDVEELLRTRLPALGPEASSDASRHDDAIFVASHEL